MLKLFLIVGCVILPSACRSYGAGVILGYSAAFREEVVPPAAYDFTGVTHIARAFAHPNADGSLGVPDGFFNPTWEAAAHQHGVKLLISLGGGAGTADNWITLATHPQNLHRFLDGLDQLITLHHYDGVDVDWEPMPATAAEGQAYTSFLKALRTRFPTAVLTTALDDWANEFSWSDVVANVDYVNLMTYDYAGSWTGVARHGTNLHPAGDYPPVAGHSVEEGLRKVIEVDHVPASKLLLGFNFYAYRYRTDHIGGPFRKNADADSDDLSYPQVMDLLQTGHYQQLWDAKAQAPYLERNGGGSVISFDTPESIRLKCDYGKQLGCAGVIIWNLGADLDGEQSPLMDAVVQAAGARPAVLSRPALEAQVVSLREQVRQVSGQLPSARPGEATEDALAMQPLSSLSQEQLEETFADLQRRWGILDDQLWQEQGSRTPGK